MVNPEHHIAFGPVPSRRLGQSLGINNVPTKVCSYSCVYCQVGPTTDKTIELKRFFSAEQTFESVESRLRKIEAAGLRADYLTFVPDGEPTLDGGLGESMERLRGLGLPIAVITNGSLLWREDVRAGLRGADLVSVKVDCADEGCWRAINRPHPDLDHTVLLDGIKRFAAEYAGKLITDTMLIAGINDDTGHLSSTSEFLASIAPDAAYLAVPTRPTTVEGVQGAGEAGLTQAYEIFSSKLDKVELLTGHEVGDFGHTGNARDDLLAVTAVHPMRQDDVRQLLAKDDTGWELVDQLVSEGALKVVEHEGRKFYLRPVRCHRHLA